MIANALVRIISEVQNQTRSSISIGGPNISKTIFLLLCLSSFSISGCMKGIDAPTRAMDFVGNHVIMFNGTGHAVDPTGNTGCTSEAYPCNGQYTNFKRFAELSKGEFRDQADKIISAMKSYTDVQYKINGKRKVLLFIHGGLNSHIDGIKRATKFSGKILDNYKGSFPIFLNWDSSLTSSYVDHLFFIRRDQDQGIIGVPFAPFYLVMDLFRGLARAPESWFESFVSDFEQVYGSKQREITNNFREAFQNRDSRALKPNNRAYSQEIAISTGIDRITWAERLTAFTSYLITLPTKLVTKPFIDGMGRSAWENMVRRTQLLFYTPDNFGLKASREFLSTGVMDMEGKGALSDFLRRFQKEVNDSPGQWEITLIGHSMGTIIINQLLRKFSLPFKNIVYLAAACSVGDYQDSAFSFMNKNTKTHIYHVFLHREAELREKYSLIGQLDPTIRGSLLVWLDDFLANVNTPLDRTAGREDNLLPALSMTPAGLRGRIHAKAFGVGGDSNNLSPQGHGDFENFPFWKPSFWEPERPYH